MIAIYEPADDGKRLNVREAPAYSAPVVRRMGPGSEECTEVARGWCRLADGWADASFLTVKEGAADAEGTEGGAEEAPERPEPAEAAGGEGDVLRGMTVKELRELAAESGIAVPKSATKEEIVHAVLAG